MRLTAIDDTIIGDHYHLTSDDECYFLHEYTSRRGYSFSSTNNLISNLKKSPLRSQKPEYRYKIRAIQDCSASLGATIRPDWLKIATLVPVPPSKAVGHPEYDDRVEQICRGIARDFPVDVRNIVRQVSSMEASHTVDRRPTPEELIANYDIDEQLCQAPITSIGIVDDVLTAGAHFRAVSDLLSRRFPQTHICGFFIARRVLDPEPEEI